MGNRKPTIAVFYNPEKERARQVLPHLRQWLKHRKIHVLFSKDPSKLRQAYGAVALGGDGTILAVTRQLAPLGIPILGVNLGRLGFLTGTDLPRMYRVLSQMLAGRLSIVDRMLLSVEVPRGKPVLALNDCVIKARSTSRVIRLSVIVNQKFFGTFVGDGLIISTPTGSTAYSLAASGPIIEPTLEVIILTPICPHSLTQRPVILSSESELEIAVERHDRQDQVLMSVDGQLTYPLHDKNRVRIKRATEHLKLFTDPEQNYFELLRQKLKWGS